MKCKFFDNVRYLSYFLPTMIRTFLLSLTTFCAFVLSVFADERSDQLPQRLVLAMDGVPYEDVERMQWEGEVLRDFFPVSRNISTYPSISDVAWADIFRTEAPDGYQRYHYSVRKNRIVGGSMSDLGNPIEYERRMHMAFEDLPHHLRSYLFSAATAKDEIRAVEERFFQTRGTQNFYVYLLSTDTLQHTGGDIRSLMRSIDTGLQSIQQRYARETGGKKLEIALVSDHGHNHRSLGRIVPFESELARRGFRTRRSITQPGDVVFTTAGILSVVSLYAQEGDLERLTQALLPIEGVDLVTRVMSPEKTRIFTHTRGQAEVEALGNQRYIYRMIEGRDPLGYAAVIDALARDGKLADDGSASAEDWVRYTGAHRYPAAPERIHRGHRFVTKNPAKLIASLQDGYENGDPTVKWMTNFKRRGGTHGALLAKDSNGILVTNFRATHDTTTRLAGEQLEWSSMNDYRTARPGARFLDGSPTGWDYLSRAAYAGTPAELAGGDLFLSIWDPLLPVLRPSGTQTRFRVQVSVLEPFSRKTRVIDRLFDPESLPRLIDRTEYRLPWQEVAPAQGFAPGEYEIQIVAVRTSHLSEGRNSPLSGPRETSLDDLARLKFMVDLDGQTVVY